MFCMECRWCHFIKVSTTAKVLNIDHYKISRISSLKFLNKHDPEFSLTKNWFNGEWDANCHHKLTSMLGI